MFLCQVQIMDTGGRWSFPHGRTIISFRVGMRRVMIPVCPVSRSICFIVVRTSGRFKQLVRATTCDCHERTFCYVGISSTGPWHHGWGACQHKKSELSILGRCAPCTSWWNSQIPAANHANSRYAYFALREAGDKTSNPKLTTHNSSLASLWNATSLT